MSGSNVISPTNFTTLLVADTVAVSGGSNDTPQTLAKIAGGVPIANVTAQTACYAASTTALNATYSNGSSGVGATLTNAGAQAAFSIDSVSPALNSRILIKDQAAPAQNGIYTLTTVGTGASNWVLTRATDYDSASEIIPGSYAAITAGTVNAGLSFVEIATVATVGTDAVTFRAYIGHLPVAVGLALQSTNGGFYIQGVTTAQRDAWDNTNTLIADGMMCYNLNTGLFNFRQNGAWDVIGTNAISGPATSTDKAVARWNGTTGDTLQDSVLVIGDTGAITGALSLANGAGAVATPSYTFTGDTDTGMWHSGANTVDFSTNALSALRLVAAPASSRNFFAITPSTSTVGAAPFLGVAGTDANVDVGLKGHGTGGVSVLASDAGSAANIKLWNAAGTFYTSMAAGVNAANLALTMPIADASADANATTIRVPLATDGSGTLTFSNRLTRYSSLTLSSANILALNATAITCIAAPGAGSAIVVEHFAAQLVYNSIAYTGAGNFYLQYGTTGAGTNYASTDAGIPAAFINGSASAFISANGTINSTTGLAATTVNNAPVSVTCASAFSTGNSTVVLHIWYKIVPAS